MTWSWQVNPNDIDEISEDIFYVPSQTYENKCMRWTLMLTMQAYHHIVALTRSEISLHWVRIESFPLLMADWLASWNCTLVFEGQSTLSTYPALSSICTEKSLDRRDQWRHFLCPKSDIWKQVYEVNFNANHAGLPSYSCPDWKNNHLPCKHFFAVMDKIWN
jgi:hypothetical protein